MAEQTQHDSQVVDSPTAIPAKSSRRCLSDVPSWSPSKISCLVSPDFSERTSAPDWRNPPSPNPASDLTTSAGLSSIEDISVNAIWKFTRSAARKAGLVTSMLLYRAGVEALT